MSSTVSSSSSSGMTAVRIVECSHLKVLGGLPKPPPQSLAAEWYSGDIWALMSDMLAQDRNQRLSVQQVLDRVEDLIRKQGGRVDQDAPQRHGACAAYPDTAEDSDVSFGLKLSFV